jgi:hypothetical protein
MKCAHCGAGPGDLLTRMVDVQCLRCGNRTDLSGVALPKEPVFHAENPHNRRPV